MKFAPHIELIGSIGIVTRIHAEFARRLILAGKGLPIRNGKRIVAVQLPSVPCGERDTGYHGGNSVRQHRTEECSGGATLTVVETKGPDRIVTTQSCRVYALKRSSAAFRDVMAAERAELMA